MASFALVSVEKDYKVALVEGKVTVGRGPLLQACILSCRSLEVCFILCFVKYSYDIFV